MWLNSSPPRTPLRFTSSPFHAPLSFPNSPRAGGGVDGGGGGGGGCVGGGSGGGNVSVVAAVVTTTFFFFLFFFFFFLSPFYTKLYFEVLAVLSSCCTCSRSGVGSVGVEEWGRGAACARAQCVRGVTTPISVIPHTLHSRLDACILAPSHNPSR